MSFRILSPNCPKCGDHPKGTLERMEGLALISCHEDDIFDYDGETDVYWDDQETVETIDGEIMLVCTCGEEWTSKVAEPDSIQTRQPEVTRHSLHQITRDAINRAVAENLVDAAEIAIMGHYFGADDSKWHNSFTGLAFASRHSEIGIERHAMFCKFQEKWLIACDKEKREQSIRQLTDYLRNQWESDGVDYGFEEWLRREAREGTLQRMANELLTLKGDI